MPSPVTSTLEPGLPAQRGLLPRFRIEVDGRELGDDAAADVREVKVWMDVDNLSGFLLTLRDRPDRPIDSTSGRGLPFDLGARVKVSLGYGEELTAVMRGVVTSIAPHYGIDAPPTVSVSGLDALFLLRDSKPTGSQLRKFSRMADWEIAQAVAARHGLESVVTQEGPTHEMVVQENQDDAQFLMERAKRIDFELFVQIDGATGRDALHFVRPTDGRDARPLCAFRFDRGESLIDLDLRLSGAEQVEEVTVRSWDPLTKQTLQASATAVDVPIVDGAGASGPELVSRSLSSPAGKVERVVDWPVQSLSEARELAVSLLRERAYEFITGSALVLGQPRLRPGHNVQLGGLGRRFDGLYYVRRLKHVLGSEGYRTRFEARRAREGGSA